MPLCWHRVGNKNKRQHAGYKWPNCRWYMEKCAKRNIFPGPTREGGVSHLPHLSKWPFWPRPVGGDHALAGRLYWAESLRKWTGGIRNRSARTREGKCGARGAKDVKKAFFKKAISIQVKLIEVSDSMFSLTASHLVLLLIIILTAVSGKVQFNHYLNVTDFLLNIVKNFNFVDLHRFAHSVLYLISCNCFQYGRWWTAGT